jgi:peptidoglycan hydrolase-like protein with peptidoglycan-binding domain
MILKKGSSGPQVVQLAQDLTNAGYPPRTVVSDIFNSDLEAAVKAFQTQNIGPDAQPLTVDGKVGPLTRWALEVALSRIARPIVSPIPISLSPNRPDGASKSGWNALMIAKRELSAGAGESGSDNAGPDVMRYHAVAGGQAGWDWCASFVSYCFSEGNPGTTIFEPTVGARDLLKKFKDKGWAYQATVENPPEPGDIVVWWRTALNHWHGHIGIVVGYEHGLVTTIEGNKGSFPSKVSSFTYVLGRMEKILAFGRASP